MPATKPSSKTKDKPSRLGDARARMYHDLVFESAECVFGQKGFESATMQDIANEGGVSLKTLYATYPGKQELYKDIQLVRGKAFIEGVVAASAQGTNPIDRLERTVNAHVTFLFTHRDWLRFHLLTRVSWGIRPTEENAALHWELGVGNISKILRDGIAEGLFFKADPDETAALAQAVMQLEVYRAFQAGETDVDETAGRIMLQLGRLLCPRGSLEAPTSPS
jgi:AcrR family transcriptional regulator